MIKIYLSGGQSLDAIWADEIRGGAGGVMIDTPVAPFSMLAELFEGSSSMSWEDDEGQLHTVEYSRIKHMTRSPGRVQLIVDKEESA